MAHFVKIDSPITSTFFTVALTRRGDDLLLREIERLRQAVRFTRYERPFQIDAWVVLPDHLHAIWTLPAEDGDFSTRWRLIKARFSAGLPKARRGDSPDMPGESGIWKRRFFERHLRSAEDFAAHMRFCKSDPVKHGLVEHASDWPFSSFQRPKPQLPVLQLTG